MTLDHQLPTVDAEVSRLTEALATADPDEFAAISTDLAVAERQARHLQMIAPARTRAKAETAAEAARAAKAAKRILLDQKLGALRSAVGEFATAVASAQAAIDQADAIGRDIADTTFDYPTLATNGGYLVQLLRGGRIDQLAINEAFRVSRGRGPLARPDQVSFVLRHNYAGTDPLVEVIEPELAYVLNVFDKD